MNIFKRTFVLIACFSSFIAHAAENDYFQTSQTCSEQQLSDVLREKTLDMSWYFEGDSHFRFVSSHNEVYFEICLGTLPETFNDLIRRVRHKFIQIESGQLIFTYRLSASGYQEINTPTIPITIGHPEDDCNIVADSRIMTDAHPSLITQKNLETIIKNNNVLFYTGAGLSLASSIPAMSELEELLGLVQEEESFLYYLEKAIKCPLELAEKIRLFHEACVNNVPSPAHFALRDLSLYKSTRLITENLDCLHEASGIYPYRINPIHLKEQVGEKCLTQIDYIVCIGLSFDHRGFLGWYKNQNPNGKIISIDFSQPLYLGNEDFWIKDDLQTLIPDIRNAIFSHKNDF